MLVVARIRGILARRLRERAFRSEGVRRRHRGLSARELPEPAPDSQRWIEVTRA